MLPTIRLGPFLLQTPGLALLIGVWVGSWLAEREARRLKLDPTTLYNLIFFALISGIVGARLAYAGRYLSAYLADPRSLFALNPNTLAPTDGLLIALIVAYIYGRWKKLPLQPTLDALAPGLAILMVAVGGAHILSGDAFGAPTELPWALYLWDEFRHPAQIYETLLALVIFGLVIRRPLGQPGRGLNFLLAVALSAGARIFLEAFRGDSIILPGGFRAAQLVSLVILLVCLWLLRTWGNPHVTPGTSPARITT